MVHRLGATGKVRFLANIGGRKAQGANWKSVASVRQRHY